MFNAEHAEIAENTQGFSHAVSAVSAVYSEFLQTRFSLSETE